MKKLSLVMTLVLILGCMVFVSGCGSDKFEGKWVGHYALTAVELDIQKNGKGYILNSTNYTLLADDNKAEKTAIMTGWEQADNHGLKD